MIGGMPGYIEAVCHTDSIYFYLSTLRVALRPFGRSLMMPSRSGRPPTSPARVTENVVVVVITGEVVAVVVATVEEQLVVTVEE